MTRTRQGTDIDMGLLSGNFTSGVVSKIGNGCRYLQLVQIRRISMLPIEASLSDTKATRNGT